MSPAEIKAMTRDELIHYLTSCGFQCRDNESTADLRIAALENYRTEKA